MVTNTQMSELDMDILGATEARLNDIITNTDDFNRNVTIEPVVIAKGQVLFDFDDISDTTDSELFGGQSIGDFFWSEDWGVIHKDYLPGSGYEYGTVSPPYSAFNGYSYPVSITSDQDFTLNSAYLTSAWSNNLDIQLKGLNDGQEVHSKTVTVNNQGPTLVQFDFTGVDEVQFESEVHFVIDDLVYEFEEEEPGSISGYNWEDLNGNSQWDNGEAVLEGWTIYIDENKNGQLDGGEKSTTTDGDGYYEFKDLAPGTYVIAEVIQEGWTQTYPKVEAEIDTSLRSQSSLSSFSETDTISNGNTKNTAADGSQVSASESETKFAGENLGLENSFVENEIIVKINNSLNDSEVSVLENLKTQIGARTVKETKTSELEGLQLWEFDGETIDVLNQLQENPVIEYAELNYEVQKNSEPPNDPMFNELWGLDNETKPEASIQALNAWDIQTGSKDIVVGVIDTGIDYSHSDLANNMWTNSGETPGNGIDDDNNGYIDDYYGYDFAYGDGDPMDGHSHGTHVAGTIGAEGNNELGIVGVNHQTDLMAIKFLNDQGSGSTFDAILAVEYATMMGADITNNSWGGGGFSQGLYDAIAAAGEANSLFVASAGNSSSNNDNSPSYPGSYDLENIIAVAATDKNDNMSGFSNYGATKVDLGAPGSSILSTVPGPSYASYSGTSMASPHVAGVAALVLAEDPNLSYEEVKKIILENVDPISALNGKTLTGGRLNAYNALSAMGSPPENPGTHTVELNSGETITEINFGNQEIIPGSISGVNWHDLDGNSQRDDGEPVLEGWKIYIDENENGQLDDGETSTTTNENGYYEFMGLDPGTYSITEVIQDGWEQTYPSKLEVIFEADFSSDDNKPDLDGFTLDNGFIPEQSLNILSRSGGEPGTLHGNPTEGLWHLSTRRGDEPGHSAQDSMYYGDEATGDYDKGHTAGRIISPDIDLSDQGNAELSFNYFLETEDLSPWDSAKVLISTDGGTNFEEIASNHENKLEDPTTGWINATFDLNDYVGETIKISFEFNTGDQIYNRYEGWYIDDVTVRASVESQYHKVELDNGETFDDIDFGNLALEAEPDLTIIEDEGTASFAQDKDKTYWIINNETQDEFQLHHKDGTTYNDESSPHWDGAAAEAVEGEEGGYRFLLDGDKGRKGQALVWDTDENGKIMGNSGWISDKTSLHDFEEEFNHDLNDDGLIGEPDLTIIEDDGTASFAQDKDKTYWIINNETQDKFQLHHKNGTTYNDESSKHWDGAAAEVGDSGYRFLLDGDKKRKGQAFVWDTDENGKIVGNSGWISDETSLHDLEKEFNHDLNDDGVIPASNNLEDEIAAIDTNMIGLATANLF
jgi:subtilisin family serine protease